MLRPLLFASFVLAQALTPECGSSSSPGTITTSPTTQNVVSVVMNPGPANTYANGLFTSVTICVPGQSTCQTIDGVLVDTGSVGLRVLSSVLTLQLPKQTINGNSVVECFQFLDGFTWGQVENADVKIAGEQASSVPIQVIGEAGLPPIPTSCSSTGASEDTLNNLGANGILGVGLFLQDCGFACTFAGSSNPGVYYSCSASSCQVTNEPLNLQVPNPVSVFGTDNNGVVIQLPSIVTGGQASSSGVMAFGIGTQSNNGLGSAKVLTTDASGYITTIFNGVSYSSFIDSGSNAYYFLDSKTTNLPLCPDTSDFYCPATTQTVNATQRGANNTTSAVTFTVANADPLLNNLRLSVFGELAGPNPGAFDWGLPFFFGRTVFTAIEGKSTPGGPGPYFAY
jgi:hypothetical protein